MPNLIVGLSDGPALECLIVNRHLRASLLICIVSKRQPMIKPSTQDQLEGELNDVKGKVKKVAGSL